jgi:hypothetical protein
VSRLKVIGILAKSLITSLVRVHIVHRAEIRTASANILRALRGCEEGFLMGQRLQRVLGLPVTENAPLPMLYALSRLEGRCLILHYRVYCQQQGCHELHSMWCAADRLADAGDQAAKRPLRDQPPTAPGHQSIVVKARGE